ncbi:MAG: hypothetical protein WCI18_16770 [Pseudomonadota bacterium]
MEQNRSYKSRASKILWKKIRVLGALLFCGLACPKLNGAQIDSWHFDIDSCASGLSATIDSPDRTSLALYLGDQNCLGKLRSFSLSGKTYYPKKGSEFSTWTPGSTSVFTDQSRDFDVQVTNQLPEIIGKSNAITYQIFDKEQESITHTIGSFSIGNPTFIQKKPGSFSFNFIAKKIQIKELNFNSQSLGLEVELECTTAMTQNGICIRTNIENLSYALIENKYKGSPCQVTDPATCWKIIKDQNNSPIVTKQSSSTYNGGFVSAKIDTLHSPFRNPKYLLMLGSSTEVWILPLNFISRSTY